MSLNKVKIFATRGSDGIAREICGHLGLALGETKVEDFSNENMLVQVENVRGHFIVIVHTQAPPVSRGLIELFHLIDAVNNAQAAGILLAFSYMPYVRSDKKDKPRISTFGKTLPNILTKALRIERVILLDPHDSHIKHYFEPAADEISAVYLLVDYIERNVFNLKSKQDSVVVFSDEGASKRYGGVAGSLCLPSAYIPKEHLGHSEKTIIKEVVGDVKGKFCLLIDDEIMTGGTAIGDANLLLEKGATSVSMMAVHAIFADREISDAELIKKLETSPIERFVVTDSIPVRHKLGQSSKITVISVTRLLAEAIKRAVLGQSLTALYGQDGVKLYRGE